MKTTHLTLLVGLFLGAAAAFGSIGQFLVVLLFGLIGLAVGLALDGRIEIRGLTDRWGR
ncbi:hypothetical protein [Dietzia sp. CH92]|uniref:hypothetical protein n=1 Tax=Dietzia sp. CH92 TaxID=3051823 RepID=UPI0028D588B4|nr:hypothetical protein [Dietzia sp. CH92]